MIIRERPVFTLNDRKILTAMLVTFIVGVLTLIGLAFTALLALAYLLNLILDAFTELTLHFAAIYTHGDSLTKLLMWIFAFFFLVKLTPYLARFVRRSLSW